MRGDLKYLNKGRRLILWTEAYLVVIILTSGDTFCGMLEVISQEE